MLSGLEAPEPVPVTLRPDAIVAPTREPAASATRAAIDPTLGGAARLET
jgi:hypothetical protein